MYDIKYIGIILKNNDTTPMEHVVELAEFAFGYDEATAFEFMLKVHKEGEAIFGVLPAEKADAIRARMDSYINQMEQPVVYELVEDPPIGKAHVVSFDGLLELEDFLAQKSALEKNRRFWLRLIVILILAIVPVLFLFWTNGG